MKKTFVFIFITSSAVWATKGPGEAFPGAVVGGAPAPQGAPSVPQALDDNQNPASNQASAGNQPTVNGQAPRAAGGKIPRGPHFRHALKKACNGDWGQKDLCAEIKRHEHRYSGKLFLESSKRSKRDPALERKIKNIRPGAKVSVQGLYRGYKPTVGEGERSSPALIRTLRNTNSKVSRSQKDSSKKPHLLDRRFPLDSFKKLDFLASQREYRRFHTAELSLLCQDGGIINDMKLFHRDMKRRLVHVKIDTDFTTPPELKRILRALFARCAETLESVEIHCKYDPLHTCSFEGRRVLAKEEEIFPSSVPSVQTPKKLKRLSIYNSLFVEPLKEAIGWYWNFPALKEFNVTEVSDWEVHASSVCGGSFIWQEDRYLWETVRKESHFKASPLWKKLILDLKSRRAKGVRLEDLKEGLIEKLKALKERDPLLSSKPVTLEELGFSNLSAVTEALEEGPAVEALKGKLLMPHERVKNFPSFVQSEDESSVDRAKFLRAIDYTNTLENPHENFALREYTYRDSSSSFLSHSLPFYTSTPLHTRGGVRGTQEVRRLNRAEDYEKDLAHNTAGRSRSLGLLNGICLGQNAFETPRRSGLISPLFEETGNPLLRSSTLSDARHEKFQKWDFNSSWVSLARNLFPRAEVVPLSAAPRAPKSLSMEREGSLLVQASAAGAEERSEAARRNLERATGWPFYRPGDNAAGRSETSRTLEDMLAEGIVPAADFDKLTPRTGRKKNAPAGCISDELAASRLEQNPALCGQTFDSILTEGAGDLQAPPPRTHHEPLQGVGARQNLADLGLSKVTPEPRIPSGHGRPMRPVRINKINLPGFLSEIKQKNPSAAFSKTLGLAGREMFALKGPSLEALKSTLKPIQKTSLPVTEQPRPEENLREANPPRPQAIALPAVPWEALEAQEMAQEEGPSSSKTSTFFEEPSSEK